MVIKKCSQEKCGFKQIGQHTGCQSCDECDCEPYYIDENCDKCLDCINKENSLRWDIRKAKIKQLLRGKN